MLPALLYLGFGAVCLVILATLNHQIVLLIFHVLLRATSSIHAAATVYFLLTYPGIFVHEAAHWMVALVLGLQPSAFSVWPQLTQDGLLLGYVLHRRTNDLLSNALVGAAPLMAGSSLIALISRRVFDINQIIDVFDNMGWFQGLLSLISSLARVDRLPWLYLLFALANGMMLSRSDREPLRPALGFVIFAAIVFLAVGLPLGPIASLLGIIFPALEALVTSLMLIIMLDIAVLFLLGILAMVTSRPT